MISKVGINDTENSVFDLNTGFFLTFWHKMRNAHSIVWNNFGTLAVKTCLWGTVRMSATGYFLCLFSEQNIRDTFSCFNLVFLYDVCVEIFGGACAGVS